MVSPEIADLDEVNTVVVEKRRALYRTWSGGSSPDGVIPYHQVPQDGELDVLSSMLDLSACILQRLTSN